MKLYTVAVLGATGAVGQEMISALEERNFPVGKLVPLASARSVGKPISEAVLTGPETRSTSPVRVLRSEKTLEAIGISGLYPTGEGAGYSGGIISSARDGLLVAEAMLTK